MAKNFPSDFNLHPTFRMHYDNSGLYWFYHKIHHSPDAPHLYKNLVSTATTFIDIWDPYYNLNSDYQMFDNLSNNIEIRLLTLKGLSGRNMNYINDLWTELKANIDLSKNIRLGIRVVNLGDMARQGNLFFHDRFLIIDKQYVYLIGSSLGWHINSDGILKVNDSNTVEFIVAIFDEYWKLSNLYEKPVQFLHP